MLNVFFSIGYDNRCLKPDDSMDPELWDHYDPDDFYDATSQEIYIFTALGNMKHVLKQTQYRFAVIYGKLSTYFFMFTYRWLLLTAVLVWRTIFVYCRSP